MWSCDVYLQALDINYILEVLSIATLGAGTASGADGLALISEPAFALSLALGLGCLGGSLLLAFGTMDWLLVRVTLWRVRSLLAKAKDRRSFSDEYENQAYPRLIRHPLIGHAWKEFDETLLKGPRSIDGVIGNTVRPQVFINYGVLRERLSGLKMLGSISGYFVGIGLLLTFAGIVLALHKAGASVSASNAEDMQIAMQELLQIASFKFSTSIAGLGVSIIFAIMAKLIVISLERGVASICEAAEHQMRYVAPQSLAAETNVQSKEQLEQLKEINSDRYFSKLAESITPLLEAAMQRAMSPVTEQIGSAIGKLASTSQDGVGELIEKFSSSVQGGAGAELRQLSETLRDMQTSLTQTQSSMHGSGEDFTRRISEAAENLNRLVTEAGSKLEGGAETNRHALQEMMEALRSTFERANQQIDSDLGTAASGAASKMEATMGAILEKLEGQVGGLMSSMQSFQENSAKGVETTREQIAQAQIAAAGTISSAGAEAAKALEVGLGQALDRINGEFERFETAMRSGASAYGHQASAIGDATNQTRMAADSFAEIAGNVRTISGPLLQSGDRMVQATNEMNTATREAMTGFAQLTANSDRFVESLRATSEQQTSMWAQHSARFEAADRSLAAAVEALGKAMTEQGQSLNERVGEMDRDLSAVLARLHPLVGEIGEHAEELSEAVSMLVRLQQQAAE